MLGLWVVFLIATVLATASTYWFLSGRRRGIGVAIHSDPGFPAIVRNLPLVSPVMTAVAWTILLISSPAVLGLTVELGLTTPTGRTASLGAFGYAISAVSLVFVLAFRPPSRLYPAWLRALAPPRPRATATDVAVLLLVAVPGLVIGLGIIVYAGLRIVGGV